MSDRGLAGAASAASFSAILLELVLVRVFGLVLFASFTHLALAVALLGIAVGAVIQHMAPRLVPADRLEERLAAVAAAQAATSVLAGFAAVSLPLTERSARPVVSFVLQRLRLEWELVDPLAFAALLPLLVLPFAAVGLFFAALFQHRRDRIGLLYGADLVGAATGALVLFPLLHRVPAPDVVWIAGAAALGAAGLLWVREGARVRAAVAAASALGLLGVALAAATGGSVLRVRYPAGFDDTFVVAERWTPVARLAVHETPRETRILLDNTSSSTVVRTPQQARTLGFDLGRSLVFRMHDPPARVAVLAASAGPDVAVAQALGFTGIDAIDVTPEIGDLVLERFGSDPVNPFRDGDTHRIVLDARAAVLHSQTRYDVIQLIHANLHGAGGRLTQAWSPGLLGTAEAFETWLARLSPDGTVSFARGSRTVNMARSAVEALSRRGVTEPWRHVAYVVGPSPVVLVKPRPFTAEEGARLTEILAAFPRYRLVVDPLAAEPDEAARQALFGGPVMTDDRPYTDTAASVVAAWADAGVDLATGDADDVRTERMVYTLMVIEALFVALAALALFWVPWTIDRRRSAPVAGTPILLGYAACLGYGYLAVELALIQRFVLVVGHPVIAMTVVVAAMLLASGVGSAWSAVASGRSGRRLALLAASVAIALTAATAPVLLRLALGLPLEARVALAAVAVAIPAVPMGMALPSALAALPPSAGRLIPWAWAVNGLFSVVAALGTAVAARLAGYTAALGIALAAYLIALLLSERLDRVGAPGGGAGTGPACSTPEAP